MHPPWSHGQTQSLKRSKEKMSKEKEQLKLLLPKFNCGDRGQLPTQILFNSYPTKVFRLFNPDSKLTVKLKMD